MAAEDVERSTRTLYYQVGIGSGNGEAVGDHDIWRLPQADDAYGGSNPQYSYIRERPVFRAGAPGAPVSPNLAGRDAAAFALCFQVFARHPPRTRLALPAGRRAHLRTREHRPQGKLLTSFPSASTPRRNGATTSSWAPPSSRSRSLGADGLPGGSPHATPATTSNRPPTGRRLHLAVRLEGESLNLYDVSGLADYELVRAIPSRATPAGWRSAKRGCWATSPANSNAPRGSPAATRSASASPGPNPTPRPTDWGCR